MPAPTNEKIDCPHCSTPMYPHWQATHIKCLTPNRQSEEHIGDLYATTCASCDKEILRYWVNSNREQLFPGWDHEQIFPVPPTIAIEIVIQIFVDAEKNHRRAQGEPEMTPKEEEQRKSSWRDFFANVHDVAKRSGDILMLADKAGKAWTSIQGLFPSSGPPAS